MMSRADGEPEDGGRPQPRGGGQPLDLAAGAEKDGVAADHCRAEDACGREEREADMVGADQEEVEDHGDRGAERNENERAQPRGMPFARTFAADDRRKENGKDDPEKNRGVRQRGRPRAEQVPDRVISQ